MKKPLVIALASLSMLMPAAAFAQAAPVGGGGSSEAMLEARKHYDLGLKLYEDNDFEGARVEFERAMALAPTFRILYNIGLAYSRLNNYVDALAAFERYLSEGGTQIPADRKAQVEKEINELRPRIATVPVSVNVPGAEITVDGIVQGKQPLGRNLRLNPGLRKFSVTAPGYLPTNMTVTITSSTNPEVKLVMQELPKATIIERKSNPWVAPTIVGWTTTGAAAITTLVLGVLARNARDDQENLLNKQGATSGELSDARDKTQTLAGATDALLATTIVFGAASTFFTIKMLGHDKGDKEQGKEKKAFVGPKVNLTFGVGSLGAAGTF